MKNFLTFMLAMLVVGATNIGLTSSGGIISVESGDITNVNTAGSNFLASAFEITKFLGTFAMIAGGFYVLGKLMAIIPKSGGGK